MPNREAATLVPKVIRGLAVTLLVALKRCFVACHHFEAQLGFLSGFGDCGFAEPHRVSTANSEKSIDAPGLF
jgi:hypothetical protein